MGGVTRKKGSDKRQTIARCVGRKATNSSKEYTLHRDRIIGVRTTIHYRARKKGEVGGTEVGQKITQQRGLSVNKGPEGDVNEPQIVEKRGEGKKKFRGGHTSLFYAKSENTTATTLPE